MENAFSDGSRVIYLAAGYYLVSRGARVARVQTPERDEQTTDLDDQSPGRDNENISETDLEADDGPTGVYDEQTISLETVARQAMAVNDDSQEGEAFTPENAVEQGSQQEDQVGDNFADYTLAPTPALSYYDNDSVMADEDQPESHPSVGGLTLASQGPPRTIYRVHNQAHYVVQNLLTKGHFTQMAATTYDPLWAQNNNVNPDVMTGFTSKIKLEEMFGRGVFQVGDSFQLLSAQGVAYTAKEAIVHSFPSVRDAYPDFRVHTIATRRDYFLNACNGIGQLYLAMADQGPHRRPNYNSFLVSRNGRVLGNLSDLRQALHVYLAEKQNWARQG